MKIVLLGAPGSGKGTQASKISEKYNIPHISTGDIFRENIKNQTPIGIEAKKRIDKGELVPDDITVQIVAERISRDDCKKGFMLDGFPRTIAQAEMLEKFATLDAVVDIDVDVNLLVGRITGRRICSKCGESYHVDFIGDTKTCAKCGAELYIRADDNEETVKSRLNVYKNQTEPLIDFYKNKNILKAVDGNQSVDKVFESISEILDLL